MNPEVAGEWQAFAPNDSVGSRLSRAIGDFVAKMNSCRAEVEPVAETQCVHMCSGFVNHELNI